MKGKKNIPKHPLNKLAVAGAAVAMATALTLNGFPRANKKHPIQKQKIPLKRKRGIKQRQRKNQRKESEPD